MSICEHEQYHVHSNNSRPIFHLDFAVFLVSAINGIDLDSQIGSSYNLYYKLLENNNINRKSISWGFSPAQWTIFFPTGLSSHCVTVLLCKEDGGVM